MNRLLFYVICLMIVSLQLPAASMTISDAKLLPDQQQVSLLGKAVVYADTDFFYIEEDDRSSGIRVYKPNHGLVAGFRVSVTGETTTISHERCITSASLLTTGQHRIAPLFLQSKHLGGANLYYNKTTGKGQAGVFAGTGANNIGLLIKIAGKITYADRASGIAYIDDGCGLDDGNNLDAGKPIKGVRILLPPGTTLESTGQWLDVTGISTIADVNGSPIRAILPSSYIGELKYVEAGTFLMGNTNMGEDWLVLQGSGYQFTYDELPLHQVTLTKPYRIGKYEVTRGEYRRFINDGGYYNLSYWSSAGQRWLATKQAKEPMFWAAEQNWGSPPGFFVQTESHPVVGVTHYEAEAFCKWAGGRLPTEAEWEKAARWDGTPRIFPWGNPTGSNMCNEWYDNRFTGWQTSPVGSYLNNVSPVGCQDMAGNVWEWCVDWCPNESYEVPSDGSPVVDPQGPAISWARALRGGSWKYGVADARTACRYRAPPDYGTSYTNNLGFRLAK